MNNFIDKSVKIGRDCLLGYNVVLQKDVRLGNEVRVGCNVVIYPGTKIGDKTTISDNTVLGKQPKVSPTSTLKIKELLPPLVIGSECIISASVVLYAGSKIGNKVMVGDLSSIREKCNIGDFCLIGRGVMLENEVKVGKSTKIQTQAYITAYTKIEDFVFIAPMVTTTNDNFMGRTKERFKFRKGPYIKRGARIGANSLLLPGKVIGREAFVAAGSIVTKDVPDYKLVMGAPAKVIRDVPSKEWAENQ